MPGRQRNAPPAPVSLVPNLLHDAAPQRLHDDFRLAIGGALKSWAAPRAVPLKKGEKRLAIAVEDHPLEYAHFEAWAAPAGAFWVRWYCQAEPLSKIRDQERDAAWGGWRNARLHLPFQQVWPLPPCLLHGLLLPPPGDLGVVPAQKDIRHAPAAKLHGAGIVRIFQQPLRERIVGG